jgi:hypothetical protein
MAQFSRLLGHIASATLRERASIPQKPCGCPTAQAALMAFLSKMSTKSRPIDREQAAKLHQHVSIYIDAQRNWRHSRSAFVVQKEKGELAVLDRLTDSMAGRSLFLRRQRTLAKL